MPVSTARAPQFRFNVAVVTADDSMSQEADACLPEWSKSRAL
jgi:hypothetical protein